MRRLRRLSLVALALTCAGLFAGTLSAAASPPGGDDCTAPARGAVSHVDGVAGRFALTFDEPLGPLTPRILKLLDRYRAKATFFVVGAEARAHPRLLRAIVRRGHELGNHTYSHPDLTALAPAERRHELRRTQRVIRRITGVTPCLMRPPQLASDASVGAQAARLGLSTVLCDVFAGEFARGASEVIRLVTETTSPGSIVLFHQVPIALWALPETLEGLRDRGLRPTTVGDLLARAQ